MSPVTDGSSDATLCAPVDCLRFLESENCSSEMNEHNEVDEQSEVDELSRVR